MVLLAAASLLDIADTVGDLAFVIRIMSFTYIVYWLFVTLNEQMALFGLATILTGYFLLFHSPLVVVIALIVLLVLFGGQLQMNIQFGLLSPMEQLEHAKSMDAQVEAQRHFQSAQDKMAQGAQFYELQEAEQQALMAQQQGQSEQQAAPQGVDMMQQMRGYRR